MHALAAALAARQDAPSQAVAELLGLLQGAGPAVAMDVQISSFGGVGSTQLSNHLNAYGITTNLLTDNDNLRHCPRPPGSLPGAEEDATGTSGASTSAPGRKGSVPAGHAVQHQRRVRPRHVVYLYGDPLAAVASHYRRGHACHQAQKTSGHPSRLSPASFPATFEQYVERGEDLFGLEEHFRNWATAEAEGPIVMLRYERMFDPDVASRLFALLAGHKLSGEQLGEMAAAFVASHRQRSSQVSSELYDKMYGKLLASMDRLPPLYIRSAAAGGAAEEVLATGHAESANGGRAHNAGALGERRALEPAQTRMVAKIGAPAPKFKAQAVIGSEIKEISLDDYKGKYVVLFFYPLDFTFVCPTEIVAFSDRVDEFKAINCEVIGASIDSQFTHLAFSNTPRNKGGLGGCKYPLVADLTKTIAKDYGVLIEDGPDAGVTLRGLFIISPTGVLRQITINDLPVGRSVDETLRLVKAFQFVDEHGEVCPANWNPGAKTMKADPTKSLEYFSTLS